MPSLRRDPHGYWIPAFQLCELCDNFAGKAKPIGILCFASLPTPEVEGRLRRVAALHCPAGIYIPAKSLPTTLSMLQRDLPGFACRPSRRESNRFFLKVKPANARTREDFDPDNRIADSPHRWTSRSSPHRWTRRAGQPHRWITSSLDKEGKRADGDAGWAAQESSGSTSTFSSITSASTSIASAFLMSASSACTWSKLIVFLTSMV